MRSETPLLRFPREHRRGPCRRLAGLVFLVGGLGLGLFGSGSAGAQLAGGDPSPLVVPIAVESARIEGAFRLNGGSFGASALDGGDFFLEPMTRGETTRIGHSWEGSYGPIRIIDGEYRPQFSSLFWPDTAPRANAFAFADPKTFVEDEIWDPEVSTVRLQLNFLLNGASFPGSPGEEAEFFLRDAETGREVRVGSGADGSVAIRVIPGVYDVVYSYREGVVLPQNQHATVLEGVALFEGTELDVDVASVYRIFSYRMNGEAFPVAAYDYGLFALEGRDSDDFVEIGYSYATGAIRVIPGTYDVSYAVQSASRGIVPANRDALVAEELVVSMLPVDTIEVDVAAVEIRPVVTQNGGAFGGGTYDFGRIELETRDGDRFEIGETAVQPQPVLVVAGVYDAIYRNVLPGDETPHNPFARFARDIPIEADGPVMLDVETALFEFTARLDGVPFPVAAYDFGRFSVEGEGEGNVVEVGETFEPAFSVRLVVGEYDVVYEHRLGDAVPRNSHATIAEDVVLPMTEALELNVSSERIAPRFSLDGAPFPTSALHSGAFFLRHPDGDEISLGDSHLAAPDVRVIQRGYRAEYEWRAGSDVPRNDRQSLGLVAVPEPTLGVGLASSVLAIGLLGTRRGLRADGIERREAR